MHGGTTYTFVTDGIEAALELARAAAGDKNVGIWGGANIIRDYLMAGSLDEMQVHLIPILLGDGPTCYSVNSLICCRRNRRSASVDARRAARS